MRRPACYAPTSDKCSQLDVLRRAGGVEAQAVNRADCNADSLADRRQFRTTLHVVPPSGALRTILLCLHIHADTVRHHVSIVSRCETMPRKSATQYPAPSYI